MQQITDDIWDVVRTVDVRGVLRMGHRMTVIRTAQGTLVHSPVAFEERLAEDVARLGPVGQIVAPNLQHDLFLSDWIRRFPDAAFVAVPGFAEQHPELPTGPELSTDALPEGISAYPIEGMPSLRERVLLHEGTGTLIVADLIFNLHDADDLWSRIVMWANGSWRRAAPSRLFRLLIADRTALRSSVDRLLELDFDRLVVGHGRNVETGAREVLRRAYKWLP